MQCRSEHDQWEQCLNVWGTVCAAVEVLHGAKISQTTYMMDASWKRGRINGPVLYRLYGPCRSLMTLVRCWSLTILTPTYTNPHRNLGLCLDFQPKSVFWHIKIVFRLIWGNLDSEKTCEMRFFCKSSKHVIQVGLLLMRLSLIALDIQVGFQSVFCVTCSTTHNDTVKIRKTDVLRSSWAESMMLLAGRSWQHWEQQSLEPHWNTQHHTLTVWLLRGARWSIMLPCWSVTSPAYR